MSIDWSRSTHPDLVGTDDDPSVQAAAAESHAEPAAAPRGRRAARSPSPEPPPAPPDAESAPDTSAPAPEAEPSAPEPDWFKDVRDAKDPAAALELFAKNVPPDELAKHKVLSGLIGQQADRRARQLLRDQETAAAEQKKREAAQNNDLYALGEMTQAEILQRARADAASQALTPFMDVVTKMQQKLPDEVQQHVAGKTYGEGKGYTAGFEEYLDEVIDLRVKHEVAQETRRRESALRKSVLSEVNGDEPVPERDSGTPGRVREVTDEQIAAMSMREFDALFDANGQPKPGVRHRSTRGVPLRQR